MLCCRPALGCRPALECIPARNSRPIRCCEPVRNCRTALLSSAFHRIHHRKMSKCSSGMLMIRSSKGSVSFFVMIRPKGAQLIGFRINDNKINLIPRCLKKVTLQYFLPENRPGWPNPDWYHHLRIPMEYFLSASSTAARDRPDKFWGNSVFFLKSYFQRRYEANQ